MAQSSVDSDIEDDLTASKSSARRVSLTHPKLFPERESFQHRSLQNFSDRINRAAEEELEVRRRQSGFLNTGISQSQEQFNSVSSDTSTSSIDQPDRNLEWKQVNKVDGGRLGRGWWEAAEEVCKVL